MDRTVAGLRPSGPLRLLPELLRNALSCLALAFGFAIFARAKDSDLSLLDSWQISLKRRRQWRARRSDRPNDDADYIRQLSRDGDEPPRN